MTRFRLGPILDQLVALWKWLLSFCKSEWRLNDYPIRILSHPLDPSFPPRFKQALYTASILNWMLSGSGDTPQEARRALKANLAKVNEERALTGKKPVRPGVKVPIEFASQQRIDTHPELSQDFISRILELDWAFISDESSLWDFHGELSNDLLNAKILKIYGVDVSDLERGNLAEILDRIAAQRTI